MLVDHIAIWTEDLEKIKDFYVKYFDCRSNEKYVNQAKQFSSYFLSFSDGSRIELMNRPGIKFKEREESNGFAHIAICVGTNEKVDSLTSRLETDGYVVISRPRTTGDGYYESIILDPEDNVVELTAFKDYEITEATHEDLERILYLQKCCYLSEAEIYNDYNIPPLTQKLEDTKRDFEMQTILKLVFNNKIIGSVRAYERDGTCFIGKLIVDRDYQNMGFGKLLLQAIEQRFRKTKRFELFTGFKSDKNLYLYKTTGYKPFREEQLNQMVITYLEKYSV